MPPGLEPRTLDTADGAEIAYHVRDGIDPWVLLHGLGCDGAMWDGVIAALPADVGLVIPELRGHGASTLGWMPPSVDLWASDVQAILERERVERPAIAGLSMGGYTAMAWAAAQPGRARAFAWLDTTAAPDDAAARLRRALGLATLKAEGWFAFAANLIPFLLVEHRPDAADHRRKLLAAFARAGEVGLAAALIALANRADRRPLLPAVTVPVAVVVGERDALTPPARAADMVDALPRAELTVVPGAGHMSALEEPGAVAAAMARVAAQARR